MNLLFIFIGGGIGSVLRYIISIVSYNKNYAYPFGTLIANILACFILGILFSYFETKINIPKHIKLMFISGFCGGFSTFSTFSFEAIKLYETNGIKSAVLYTVISIVLCISAVLAGSKLFFNE